MLWPNIRKILATDFWIKEKELGMISEDNGVPIATFPPV